MNDIIVMCPTVERAVMEYKNFLCNHPGLWESSYKREVNLKDGRRILFKGETEGQQAVRGFHADIITIDEFELEGITNEDN